MHFLNAYFTCIIHSEYWISFGYLYGLQKEWTLYQFPVTAKTKYHKLTQSYRLLIFEGRILKSFQLGQN
jgi:hypothetical protein